MKEIPTGLIKLPPLNLPEADLSFVFDNGEIKIFDSIRKNYFILTPEEYVRQNFVNWLTKYCKYPVSHISNEVFITLNKTRKRCDTIIYDLNNRPWMIVEYKKPDIKISHNTLNQILRYNLALKVKFLALSNGLKSFCCEVDYENSGLRFLSAFPDYPTK